ncbi:MAG TPA: bifunctional adenosylcobinamide kinase/adenosylcobinamide-phosphate guanylyltransferase [Polyangiaceae bacterium]|jgi:adenosylcobinamide kinase/adenosylcobinamide-phosphate guanylyltransferase
MTLVTLDAADSPLKVLVTGGARSGKSRYALALAERLGSERVFIATAQARDAEMADRIQRHQRDRGPGWTTVEESLNIAPLLAQKGVVVLDCLTLWLSNLLEASVPDLDREFGRLTRSLADAPNPIIVVTNEVGLGIVPENALARRFRDAAGELSQEVARVATSVILMCAGMPLSLK